MRNVRSTERIFAKSRSQWVRQPVVVDLAVDQVVVAVAAVVRAVVVVDRPRIRPLDTGSGLLPCP